MQKMMLLASESAHPCRGLAASRDERIDGGSYLILSSFLESSLAREQNSAPWFAENAQPVAWSLPNPRGCVGMDDSGLIVKPKTSQFFTRIEKK